MLKLLIRIELLNIYIANQSIYIYLIMLHYIIHLMFRFFFCLKRRKGYIYIGLLSVSPYRIFTVPSSLFWISFTSAFTIRLAVWSKTFCFKKLNSIVHKKFSAILFPILSVLLLWLIAIDIGSVEVNWAFKRKTCFLQRSKYSSSISYCSSRDSSLSRLGEIKSPSSFSI